MAFHLKYEKDGKIKRQQFSSYYECIKEREKLRKRGIESDYSESGMDVTQHYERARMGVGDKAAINRFLKMCDGIRDYRNAKRSVVE